MSQPFVDAAINSQKLVLKLNLQYRYYFSDKFLHFLDANKKYSSSGYMEKLRNMNTTVIDPYNSYAGLSFIDVASKDRSEIITGIEIDKIKKLFIEWIEANYPVEKYPRTDSFNKDMTNHFSTWCRTQMDDKEFWTKHRIDIRAGRFIKRFLGVADRDSEEFSNIYKSHLDSFDYTLTIVGGEDIIKYYNKKTYDIQNGNGGLHNSCMGFTEELDEAYRKSGQPTLSHRLQFYAKNQNCGLLILRYKGSEKIKGRALIWKASDGKIYVDRVYVDFDSDFFIYRKYIKDNKCHSHIFGDRPSLRIESNENIRQQFSSERCAVPYLDSMSYDPTHNIIRMNC